MLAHRLRRWPASNQHWFNVSCLLGAAFNPVKTNICITLVQCWANVEDVRPTLYKCYTNVLGLLGIAAGLVLLNTAGDDYKPTPTQCLLNVGPATPVLASIHTIYSTEQKKRRQYLRHDQKKREQKKI